MRLDLSSIVGDGFGTGRFAINGESTPTSFPPAGSYNSTLYGVEYPIAEGGSYFAHPFIAEDVPNQTCDVDVLNDGAGGTYTDWSTATNINYKTVGTHFATSNSHLNWGVNLVEVPSGSGNYYDTQYGYETAFHDGAGSWEYGPLSGPYYWPDGFEVSQDLRVMYQVEVPTGSGFFYDNGKYESYFWDGVGGFTYEINQGSYLAAGTFIYTDEEKSEVPAGSGNYYHTGRNFDYEHNGSGGYQTSAIYNSYFSSGTSIIFTQTATWTPVEVPTGSGNYFDSEEEGDEYTWDGSGGYVFNTSVVRYFPYGVFITDDAGTLYYWDGSGGYFS